MLEIRKYDRIKVADFGKEHTRKANKAATQYRKEKE